MVLRYRSKITLFLMVLVFFIVGLPMIFLIGPALLVEMSDIAIAEKIILIILVLAITSLGTLCPLYYVLKFINYKIVLKNNIMAITNVVGKTRIYDMRTIKDIKVGNTYCRGTRIERMTIKFYDGRKIKINSDSQTTIPYYELAEYIRRNTI